MYYHPLFHRDRPEEMYKLRRRTCPGYDGRRNRPGPSLSPPPPTTSITWSNEDEQVIFATTEENEGANQGATSPGASRIKVSRSPSPSNSPMDHPPAGRGSVSSSAEFGRDSTYHSLVSEEEKSARKASHRTSLSSDNGDVEFQNDYNRTVSQDVEMNSFDWSSSKPPADPLKPEEYVVDQLNHHLVAPSFSKSFAPIVTKKSRKAKLVIRSDNEDDFSTLSSYSFPRKKKYSKEELQERQSQLLVVEEVSRRLNGICDDYAASISGSKPHSRGKARRRTIGNNAPGQDIRHVTVLPAFGLEKPHDHYYGAGKCDLFTYDCADGFIIDVDQDDSKESKGVVTPVKNPRKKSREEAPVITTPPSRSPIVNQSLLQACMEGKLVGSTSIFERTLAAAILSFCLSTHPQDPELATKIASHLKKGPMLAKEFELYCKALIPAYGNTGQVTVSAEDLKQDWRMFSLNFIKRVVLSYHENMLLSEAENEALQRCVTSWFQEMV